MRFLFDCEDAVCLPVAYRLVDDVKAYIDTVKSIEFEDNTDTGNRKAVFKKIIENVMVKYPEDTGKLMAKLWVLEDGESPPNTFKTMSALFSNEVAVDFFTSVLPSLLTLSREVSPLLTSKK